MIGPGAIVVEQRQAVAGVAVVVVGLRIHAEGQQGIGGQVGLDDAVEHFLALAEAVDVGVVLLVRSDEAPAYVAALGQRAADVCLGAPVIPGAAGDADAALEFLSRTFANHVQGGAGSAHAVGQAGGAANDLDTVVQDHVVALRRALVVAVEQLQAVDLVVLDLEATRVDAAVVATVAATLAEGQTGSLAHHVGELGQTLVLHALAGDHRDRLRRLADRQRQTGGRAGRSGGVGTGALGGFTQADTGDAGGI